tara:strand:+ start:208 stop:498 length:291 start_codon:yes stop_codon:yes gene_type:complete
MSKELFIAILTIVYLVGFSILGYFKYQAYKSRKILAKTLEKTKLLQEEINELNKILTDPDYAKSLGITVYLKVEDNGDKYAILNNGEEEMGLKLNG